MSIYAQTKKGLLINFSARATVLVGHVLFTALARVQPESNVLAIAENKQAVVESAVLFGTANCKL